MIKIKLSGNLQDLTENGMEDIYNHYGEDMLMHMSFMFDEFKREVTRWRHKGLLVEDGIPETLVKTLDFSIPKLYPGIAVAVKTLLTYPVSTCAAGLILSSIKRLKTQTMSDGRLLYPRYL